MDERDAMRRYGRRGVARCVQDHQGDEAYFETHPIADDLRRSYSAARIDHWATERTPTSATAMGLHAMTLAARHPKAARWPR